MVGGYVELKADLGGEEVDHIQMLKFLAQFCCPVLGYCEENLKVVFD